jgi:Tfp pilus assembly protein PilF
MYLSKAVKFLDRNPNNIATSNISKDTNPNEFISHLSSQKTSEILFNYGVALYKSKKYEDAFKCFEKSANLLRNTPIVWYYMGLCCLHFNEDKK